MCGLAGIILGRPRSRALTLQMQRTFLTLLVGSEHRGPYATGAAVVGETGCEIGKESQPASKWVKTREYKNLMRADTGVFAYIGHTRWPSHGGLCYANNHPLLAGSALVCHNGTLHNTRMLAQKYGIRQVGDTDSEYLAWAAAQTMCNGRLAIGELLPRLDEVDGSMSAAFLATDTPQEVLLVKRDMPLSVWRHRRLGIYAYASESCLMELVFGLMAGWYPVPLNFGEALLVDGATGTHAIHWHAPQRRVSRQLAFANRYTGG